MGIGRRSAVLLGAGASRDAGLPLTSELAELVLRKLSAKADSGSNRPDWLNALNFTYGAMVSHRARDGSNPLDAVNIETLISALRLLGRREYHEAAPFVLNWREPTLPNGQVRADEHTSRQLIESVSQALGTHTRGVGSTSQAAINVGYYVAEIANSARNPTRSSAYSDANLRVIGELGEILTPTKTVSYLRPLGELARRQVGGLDIVTLNYDLTVESAMEEDAVTVDRGLRDWPAERIFYQLQSQVRLHKVHGSLDWSLNLDQTGVARLRDMNGKVADRPWIVVGDREKLATNGPTLELIQYAADALERADHLVIVGYGFADDHINQMIRNWLERDDARTIGLVEPHWIYPDTRTFRGILTQFYGETVAPGMSTTRGSRVQGFEGTASMHMEAALRTPGIVPESEPSLIIGDATRENFQLELVLTLVGSPLNHVHFSPSNGRAEILVENGPSRVSTGPGGIQYLARWEPGEELLIRFRLSSLNAKPITVTVDGHNLASAIKRVFAIDTQYQDGALKTSDSGPGKR